MLIVLVLVCLALLTGLVFVWIVFVPITIRIFAEIPWLPASWHGPMDDGEEVTFQGRGGSRLKGTYLQRETGYRRGVLVYCHELNGDRWNATPYIEGLRTNGYDVFTFDFRNHGSSDCIPDYEPLPWVTRHEVDDVLAAVGYVCEREGIGRVGVLGVSKGGTAALAAATEDCRIRALILDGVIPTEQMQVYFTRRFMPIYVKHSDFLQMLPDFSLGMLGVWAKLILGVRRKCRFINVQQTAARLRVPVLFIHGMQDSYVPVATVESLCRKVKSDAQLWVVPKAKHNGAIRLFPKPYSFRALSFFDQHLRPSPQGAHVAPFVLLSPEDAAVVEPS